MYMTMGEVKTIDALHSHSDIEHDCYYTFHSMGYMYHPQFRFTLCHFELSLNKIKLLLCVSSRESTTAATTSLLCPSFARTLFSSRPTKRLHR